MPPTTAVAPPDPARLIDGEQLAAMLNVSEKTVRRMDAAGKLPAPRRFGRAKRWDREELAAWLSRPKPNGKLMTRAEWSPVWAQIVRTSTKSRG